MAGPRCAQSRPRRWLSRSSQQAESATSDSIEKRGSGATRSSQHRPISVRWLAVESPRLALVPARILDLPPARAHAVLVGRAAILEDDPLETTVGDVDRKRP